MPFQKIVPADELIAQLNRSGVVKTAEYFNVTRTAIRDWMKKYGIQRECTWMVKSETAKPDINMHPAVVRKS